MPRLPGDPHVQVASIGQAGENQVRIACIINNKSRAAGRAGLGAVMDPLKAASYDKAALVIHYQRINTLADATGMCKFATKSLLQAIGIKDMLAFYHAVTGRDMDLAQFMAASDRIYNLERHMHAMEGMTRKDDLPSANGWTNRSIADRSKENGLILKPLTDSWTNTTV